MKMSLRAFVRRSLVLLLAAVNLIAFSFIGQGGLAFSLICFETDGRIAIEAPHKEFKNANGTLCQPGNNTFIENSGTHLDKCVDIPLLKSTSQLFVVNSSEDLNFPQQYINSTTSLNPHNSSKTASAKSIQQSFLTLNSFLSSLRTIVLQV